MKKTGLRILVIFLIVRLGGLILSPGTTAQAGSGLRSLNEDDLLFMRYGFPVVMAGELPPDGQSQVIGYSVQGRPLEVFRFGWGSRHKFILAAIHGGYEWNTYDLANRLMEYLFDTPGLVPPDQTLFILPLVNPDGYAHSLGIYGRANANNADINRNFDANWKSEWRRDGCWNYLYITAGTGPFSEPEAAAVRDFIQAIAVEALISYHSSGAEIYAGGVPPDQNSLDLALALERASGYDYPPHDSPCEMTGQLIDWASAQGIAAVDIELANHQSVDFDPNRRILEAFLNWQPIVE